MSIEITVLDEGTILETNILVGFALIKAYGQSCEELRTKAMANVAGLSDSFIKRYSKSYGEFNDMVNDLGYCGGYDLLESTAIECAEHIRNLVPLVDFGEWIGG